MYLKLNTVKNILLLITLGLFVSGCTEEGILGFQEDTVVPLQSTAASTDDSITAKGKNKTFHAVLKGENEVPANNSKAIGGATVSISKDETMIHYKITVANIENVKMAHLHMAPAGQNGGVVVWLYQDEDQPSGSAKGVLVEGDIMAGDVVGGLAGDIEALIEAIRSGNIYVNVHTEQIPSGEVRGQL